MKTKTVKNIQIQIGDRVRFNGRGRDIEGTVTEEKFKRPGSRSKFARLYRLHTPTYRCLVVAVDDGSGVWTVPESHCKRIGRAADLGKALTQVAHVRGLHFAAEDKRRNENFDKCYAQRLGDLKRGDDIEVEFRNAGFLARKFEKLTRSGMVGYYNEGDFKFDALGLTKERRVRFSAPEYVRIPKAKAAV